MEVLNELLLITDPPSGDADCKDSKRESSPQSVEDPAQSSPCCNFEINVQIVGNKRVLLSSDMEALAAD